VLQAAPLPRPPQVEDALEHVYALPEFAPAARSPIQEALSAAWRWIRDFIRWLTPDFDFGAAGDNAFLVFLVILMGVVGVFAVLHFFDVIPRLLRRRETPEAAARRAAGRPSRAAEWEERARRSASAGHWREAALALYQALLLRLEEKGAVRYDPSKTPGDYRREARKSAEAKGVLDGFLRAFEPVAFGGRPLDAGGYERLRDTAGRGGARG
jgi:hypothetical protein